MSDRLDSGACHRRLTSKGPALYWSDRVGRNNTIFKMPKFRTMQVGTPAVATHWRQPLLASLAGASESSFPTASLVGARGDAGLFRKKSAQVERLLDSLVIDSSKIRRELGWTPPFTMEQGLAETARWFRGGGRA